MFSLSVSLVFSFSAPSSPRPSVVRSSRSASCLFWPWFMVHGSWFMVRHFFFTPRAHEGGVLLSEDFEGACHISFQKFGQRCSLSLCLSRIAHSRHPHRLARPSVVRSSRSASCLFWPWFMVHGSWFMVRHFFFTPRAHEGGVLLSEDFEGACHISFQKFGLVFPSTFASFPPTIQQGLASPSLARAAATVDHCAPSTRPSRVVRRHRCRLFPAP